MKDKLFPKIPADLSGLSDEELVDHQAALRASAEIVVENAADPEAHVEVIGDRSPDEIVAEMTAAAEDIARIDDEIALRAAGAEEYVDAISAAAEKFKVPEPEAVAADGEDDDGEGDGDGDGDGSGDGAEAVAEVVAEAEAAVAEAAAEPVETPVAEEVAEPVLAAAKPGLRRPRPVPAQAPRSHQPLDTPSSALGLVASAGIEGVTEGTILDREAFGKAMMEKRRRMVSTPRGMREEVIVASVTFPVDEARYLHEGDVEGNMRKLHDALEPESLAASGGLCAPLTPYYDLAQVAVASRPVRDSLVGFAADRGGVIVGTPATIADIDTAITVVTAAQDAAGGSQAVKGCQHIECPPFVEVTVDVIARCLEIGNLTGRTYPELVAQWTELVMAAHARTAEGLMLDAIKGYSTPVTHGPQYGATSTMLAGILQAAAGMRSRHRMAPMSRFQGWFPTWTMDVLINDLENSQFDRFTYDRAGVEALLRSRGVDPTFYLDEADGSGQIFEAQTEGALLDFPVEAEWGIAPANSFLFVDGGTLDLGLVRDSVLNSTNDYQIFAETFENVAFIGVESLWVTSSICPDGTVAAPAEAITCTS
jgi:hypothetical protein